MCRPVKVDLPAGANASGFRVGACTALLRGTGNEVKAAAVSGHSDAPTQGLGNFHKYPVVETSDMMAGVCVLAGWDVPPPHARGPVPATLRPLLALGIEAGKLFVDFPRFGPGNPADLHPPCFHLPAIHFQIFGEEMHDLLGFAGCCTLLWKQRNVRAGYRLRRSRRGFNRRVFNRRGCLCRSRRRGQRNGP